jgi:hypothetical protein
MQPSQVTHGVRAVDGGCRSSSHHDDISETCPAHWLDRAAGQAFVAASLHNGLGRYNDALAAAERPSGRIVRPGSVRLSCGAGRGWTVVQLRA